MSIRKIVTSSLAFMLAFSAEVSSATSSITALVPFRSAELLNSATSEDVTYVLPLDKIQRSGRGWLPEQTSQVSGHLVTALYQISRSAQLDEVYQHYRQQLVIDESAIAFECAGRGCGSSNAWANNYFQDYRLYGTDANQFLLVTRQEQVFYIMYINRRGAGDVMVRLDQVMQQGEADASFISQIPVQDIPQLRRFIDAMDVNDQYYAVVSSHGASAVNSIDNGVGIIERIQASLGERLANHVTFINVGNLASENYAPDTVTFIRR